MGELKDTELWKAFESKANHKQISMVQDLTGRAADRLELVRDTFPTYTLHNHVHALNVVRLMGELLGPDVEKVSALEAAILIMSAYCHDIGMVFDDEERHNISKEPDFPRFLKDHPEAAVRIGDSKEVPEDVTEAYCRWIHPDRVYNFLKPKKAAGGEKKAHGGEKKKPECELRWDGIPIVDTLGEVCRSHGYDIKELRDDDRFRPDYQFETDLKFCALLLRLADILDFDNTRSPDEVYRYLGLSKRDQPRKEASDVEWRKHLASPQGFRFPKERAGGYVLKLAASPDHPAVEYDVRQFLDTIEGELQQGANLLKHCSDKWRSFRVPNGIDRSEIKSDGYKYGEYRFTLEQNRILELLMGENLYEDPFVFIRELLQNAIDTTRHRLYYERSRGKDEYQPEAIAVSTWQDEDSYQWVRIDDFGMGMNEEIIRKFFLKVGQSYYQSAQFRAEMLGYDRKGQEEFVPISRFGIGVLSCFIAGDRVEVSTRHVGGDAGSNSIRLQLSGLHSFYVLQSERDKHYDAEPMPGPRHTPEMSAGYREGDRYGTSVAVRLDPRKENKRLNLREVLDKYVLCPPVPVTLDGEEIGGDPHSLIHTTWADGVVEEELTAEETAEVEKVFGLKFTDKIKVRLVPLDLTAHSPTPSLKGQALLGCLVMSDKDMKEVKSLEEVNRYSADYPEKRVESNISFLLSRKEGMKVNAYYRNPPRLRQYEEEANNLRRRIEELQEERRRAWESGKYPEPPDDLYELERRFDEIRDKMRYVGKDRQVSVNLNRIFGRVNPHAKDFFLLAPVDERAWLSHNGIAVPTQFGFYAYNRINLSGSGEGGQFWLRQMVALSDALRPDISLSRDRLRYLTWNVYSAVTLAFRKAIGSYADASLPLAQSNVFTSIIGTENFLLGNLLNDPLIACEGGWTSQDIIQTADSRMSLEKIRAGLAGKSSFTISGLPSIDSYFTSHYNTAGVIQTCAAALVQIGLKVTFKAAGYSTSYVVNTTEAPVVREGQKLFPPLFFAPYAKPNPLRHRDGSLNQLHPFADWLIEHAVTIHEKYPGIFEALRRGVSVSAYGLSEANIAELNETLDRLWVLDARIRPPKKFRLTLKDFGK